MNDIWETLETRIKDKNITIVFPEGEDVRILGAVARHQKDGLPRRPALVQRPGRQKEGPACGRRHRARRVRTPA